MKTRKLLEKIIGHDNFDYEMCFAGGVFIREIGPLRNRYPNGKTIELNFNTYYVWNE